MALPINKPLFAIVKDQTDPILSLLDIYTLFTEIISNNVEIINVCYTVWNIR